MKRNRNREWVPDKRIDAPSFGFLPLLLAACQPVIARYGQQSLSLQENQATGGEGKDHLTGGGGADMFVTYRHNARTTPGQEDVITDFQDGRDLIGLKKAHSGNPALLFSDLTFQASGTDTRIAAGSKYLWLVENMAPTDFSADDFIAIGLAADGFA